MAHDVDLRAVRSASGRQQPFYPVSAARSDCVLSWRARQSRARGAAVRQLNATPPSCRRCITSIIPQYLFNEVLSYLPVYPELMKLCLTSHDFARISHIISIFRPQCGKCEVRPDIVLLFLDVQFGFS